MKSAGVAVAASPSILFLVFFIFSLSLSTVYLFSVKPSNIVLNSCLSLDSVRDFFFCLFENPHRHANTYTFGRLKGKSGGRKGRSEEREGG